MTRKMIVPLAVLAACAIPGPAAAASPTLAQVTAVVKKQYTQQISARAKRAGFKFIATTMKCAVAGRSKWTCYATYTIEVRTTYAKYGQYIDVTGTGWKARGKGKLLETW